MQAVDDVDQALAFDDGRLADVVGDWDARADEVVVLERAHGHVLLDPVPLVLGAARQKRPRGVAPEVLAPARPVELVEHRRAPVHRPPRRTDRQHRRRFLRKAHAVVVRVPDIAHADGFLRPVVEVPVLPVEETALGDGRRARQRERTEDDECAGAECEPAGALRQPGEQQQRNGQDDDAAPELTAAGEQRGRPACPHQEHDHCHERVAGGHRQSNAEAEGEDRDEDDLVHPHVLVRIEWEPEIVEVQKAAVEATADGRDVLWPQRKRNTEREERRCDNRGETRPPGAHERRHDREHGERERTASAGVRVLEAKPVDRDHESGDAREQSGPNHAAPLPSASLRAARPDRLPRAR